MVGEEDHRCDGGTWWWRGLIEGDAHQCGALCVCDIDYVIDVCAKERVTLIVCVIFF